MEHKTQRRRRRSKQYEEFPSYETRYDYYEDHDPGYSPGYSPIRTTHEHNHERSYRSESRGSRCRSEQSRHSRSSSSRYSFHRTHSRLNDRDHDPEFDRQQRKRIRQEDHHPDRRYHRRSHHKDHRRSRPNDQYETGWFSPSAGYRDDRRPRRRNDHLAQFGFEIDGQTRETIRRIAFSTLVASVTVLVICGLARWKEVERPQSEGPLWDLDQIKSLIFNKVPTCEGVGIASILIGLLYL